MISKQLRVAHPGAHFLRQVSERARPKLVSAQNAEPGARHRRECVDTLVVDQPVLAVTEEREVIVGQPPQELHDLAGLRCRHGDRRLGLEFVSGARRIRAHLGPVLDGIANVLQDPHDVSAQSLFGVLIGRSDDLQMHPRFDEGIRWSLVRVERAGDGEQLPMQVATNNELRVHDEMDRDVGSGEFLGDRIDEERHVVGDDLDDRVARLRRRREDPHLRHAGRPDRGELTMPERDVTLLRIRQPREIFRRDVRGSTARRSRRPPRRQRRRRSPVFLVRRPCAGSASSWPGTNVSLIARVLVHRSRFCAEPALSLVPLARPPPNGCWPTTAPVGLSLT